LTPQTPWIGRQTTPCQRLFEALPTHLKCVIPAKNEEESLPHMVCKCPPWLLEVVDVDGLSRTMRPA
jgi:hypothetical protein